MRSKSTALLNILAAANRTDASSAEDLCREQLSNVSRWELRSAYEQAGPERPYPRTLPNGCYFLCVLGAGPVPKELKLVPWDGKCFLGNGSIINRFGQAGKACPAHPVKALTAHYEVGPSWADPAHGGAVVIQYSGLVSPMRDELRDAGDADGFADLHDTWLGKFYLNKVQVVDFALLPVMCNS